jgi:hypothetical protein
MANGIAAVQGTGGDAALAQLAGCETAELIRLRLPPVTAPPLFYGVLAVLLRGIGMT